MLNVQNAGETAHALCGETNARRYAASFRETHGELPSYIRIRPDARLRIDHEHRFVNALIQWEYRDPTIEMLPDAP